MKEVGIDELIDSYVDIRGNYERDLFIPSYQLSVLH